MKRFFSLVAVFSIVCLLLSGCGQGEQQAAESGQQEQTTASGENNNEQGRDETTAGKDVYSPQDAGAAEDSGQHGSTGEKLTNALAGLPEISPVEGANQNKAPAARPVTTLYPVPEITADERIELRGKTKAGNKIFVNGREAEVSPAGQFKENILLKPGENRLEIITLGKKDTAEKQELVVKYQPPAPKLLVIVPDSSESEVITLSGQTEPECIVYVNSSRTLPDKTGKFTFPVKLKPGSNTIKVVSANDRGGQAITTRNINFTPPEPRLVVVVPDETTVNQLNISGITDENAVLVVYVNDVKTTINNQSGIFSGTVQLQEGLNAITIQVANKWGKTKTEYRNVFYEVIDDTTGF